MGTKNDPGDYDCYVNAEDDEPMFILLARDWKSPIVVRVWAFIFRCKIFYLGVTTSHDLTKHNEALKCANDMKQWRRENR